MTAKIIVFDTENGTRYCCKRGMHMSPEFISMTGAILYALEMGWEVEE